VHSVVRPRDAEHASEPRDDAFVDEGVLVDSGAFTGMASAEAAEAISQWCASRGIGQQTVRFHLRDWLISRQRYWGPPIPIIYCPEHGAVPVPEEELPVLLPDTTDFAPRGTGSSPLAAIASFVQTTCPVCGAPARRETDVSDNFLDSAWYYLRYPSTGDDSQPWDQDLTRRWLPPALYIGGAEHSVLHLMYARFIAMALHDLGLLDFEEPFPRFRANGMITKDGAKISKSRGNSVNPDVYIARYGADVFRTYLMFMGPYEAGGDFSDAGIGGVVRFMNRLWRVVEDRRADARPGKPGGDRLRLLQRAIEQVTRDVQALKYNTAIAALMKYLGELDAEQDVTQVELSVFLRLLAPFAPFVTEELWERIGEAGSVHASEWPLPESAPSAEVEILVVQVNGRVRDRIELPARLEAEEIRRRAVTSARVQRFLGGRAVRAVVHVPGRLLNIVVDEAPSSGSGSAVGEA
jgi:leucyl-tRNA synthetase